MTSLPVSSEMRKTMIAYAAREGAKVLTVRGWIEFKQMWDSHHTYENLCHIFVSDILPQVRKQGSGNPIYDIWIRQIPDADCALNVIDWNDPNPNSCVRQFNFPEASKLEDERKNAMHANSLVKLISACKKELDMQLAIRARKGAADRFKLRSNRSTDLVPTRRQSAQVRHVKDGSRLPSINKSIRLSRSSDS